MLAALVAAIALAAPTAKAAEGMWTFDAFPSERVREAFGWGPDAAWLNRVQQSAVRLTSGCSASFVSNQGLILTNWHCVSDCISNLITPENDPQATGFHARTLGEEKTCPGVGAQVLTSITDVTDRVRAATAGRPQAEFSRLRDAEIGRIESEACRGIENQFQCEVVSLYRGGQFKLYKYRDYRDVRLVFAPEFAVGFFGGDPDNFNFPRFNLDAAFLRAYEDGKPVQPAHFLPWRQDAVAEGDLVFVAGNPGSTSRLATQSQLAFLRNWQIPVTQNVRSQLRGRLYEFARLSADNRRDATDITFSVENSFKAWNGRLRALSDAEFMGVHARAEQDLRRRVAQNRRLSREIGDPWADMDAAVRAQEELFLRHQYLEANAGSFSSLFSAARMLLRGAAERTKPSAERLPEFADARLEEIERQFAAEYRITPGLERIAIETWLTTTRELLSVDDPAVQRLLGTESPENLAIRLTAATTLGDPAARLALWRGGQAAIEASTDPLIQFVRRTDADARAVREQFRTRVAGPRDQAAQRIAQARFAVLGTNVYPDATFTLRLSFGRVQGWTFGGRTVTPFTTMGGVFTRATGSPPFALPQRWLDARGRIDPSVPFNLVSSNDIIGGNSGSPLIDREGRVVGAVFDGNIHSLGGDYGFDPRVNRAVSVTTAAIGHALDRVYGADNILRELGIKPTAER
jgi:hypothetical protein